MPRYYCDFCDAYLTHDSRSVRKQHNAGFKHKVRKETHSQKKAARQCARSYFIFMNASLTFVSTAPRRSLCPVFLPLFLLFPLLVRPM